MCVWGGVFDSFAWAQDSFPPTGLTYLALIWGLIVICYSSSADVTGKSALFFFFLREMESEGVVTSGRRGHCGWNIIYEHRIKKEIKRVSC